MAVCKKCGKNLKKTNIVLSVESGSVAAQNEISKGDAIVAVDGKPVKNKDEIETALKDKTECQINISHEDQTRTVSIKEAKDFLKGIDFTDEDTCSSCGAKQKGSKVSIVVGFIISIVVLVLILLLVYSKRNRQVEYSTSTQNEMTTNNKNAEKNEEYDLGKVEVLTEQQKEKVENDIDKKRTELHPDDKNEVPRYEEIPAAELNDDDFNDEIQKELKELYDKLGGNDTDDEDSPFGNVSSKVPIEKESKGGPGLGENKTQSDKLASDKAVRIYFDYGSYLNTRNISMANYLRGNQDIETSADIEYAQFYLAIDDLIKTIPENKRNKATFAVVGYADTSFRNGVSDKGAESKKFNTDLSLKRAEAVVKMLITERNISADRILPPKGRGFEKLIRNREDGKENHERSRRVEVFCYAD